MGRHRAVHLAPPKCHTGTLELSDVSKPCGAVAVVMSIPRMTQLRITEMTVSAIFAHLHLRLAMVPGRAIRPAPPKYHTGTLETTDASKQYGAVTCAMLIPTMTRLPISVVTVRAIGAEGEHRLADGREMGM